MVKANPAYKIVPACRRTISFGGNYVHLSFPELLFFQNWDGFRVFAVFKKRAYPLFLTNIFGDGSVCLKYKKQSLDKNIANFWLSSFGLPLHEWGYMAHYIAKWRNETLKNKEWIPSLRFFKENSKILFSGTIGGDYFEKFLTAFNEKNGVVQMNDLGSPILSY